MTLFDYPHQIPPDALQVDSCTDAAIPRISFDHKWVVDNFSHLYQNPNEEVVFRSNMFDSPSSNESRFYLRLTSTSFELSNYLKIYLFLKSKFDRHIQFRISLLNDKGEKCHSIGRIFWYCVPHNVWRSDSSESSF